MILESQEIKIMKAEYAGEYKLSLLFNDDTEQCIDFYPFLSSSLNPLIQRYLDIEEFSKFNAQAPMPLVNT